MKKLLLSTACILAALAHGAGAGELPLAPPPAPPVPPPPIWTGFYLGIQGGAASQQATFNDLNGFNFSPPVGVTYTASTTGGIGGFNAGYNFQAGPFVFGLEGDWNWLGVHAGALVPCNTSDPCTFTTAYDVRWLSTVRGRFGTAIDLVFIYVTGGAAFGQVQNNATLLSPDQSGIFNESTTRSGWTAGAGAEYMFAPNWTARLDIRYVNFGRSTVTCVTPVGPVCSDPIVATYRGEFSSSLATAMVGVAFQF